MSTFLQLIISIIVILTAAKVAGYLATRIGQPAVLGELLAGVLLGPSLLNFLHFSIITNAPFISEALRDIGELGILFLMFLAGLELHPRELAQNHKTAILASVGGALFSMILGVGIGLLLELQGIEAVFLGLCIGATSVSISAQILMEAKLLRTSLGMSLLGAAVLDDMLIILLLSVFLSLTQGAINWQTAVVTFVKMFVFLIASILFGYVLLPWISRKVSSISGQYGILTFAIVILLSFSLAAEWLGSMAAISGAFIAGLMFSRTAEKSAIEVGMRSLAYSFFVPIFFVNIGLEIDLHTLDVKFLWITFVVLAISIIGKLIGASLGAKLSGFRWNTAFQLGIGMMARGEVTLIAIKLGLERGYLTDGLSSALIAVVVITSLLTPSMLRAALKWKDSHETSVKAGI